MVNYNNGKIYKIEPINGEEGDIYIGSTTKEYLSQRMDNHRSQYKLFIKGKKQNTTALTLFAKYGMENCKIILLELVNVNSKDELLIREAHYIKTLQCVNKHIPLRTLQEYYQDNKDKIKEYYKDNKDKIKGYQEINKDNIKNKKREYYQDNYGANKDKINERRRELRKLKKLQLLELN